jgi:amino acid adenylation domain-containing protein
MARPGRTAPLSFAQQQVWLHAQLAPDVPLYHEPFTVHRRGPLDVGALRSAVAEVIRRHEAWRTTFPTIDGEPVQVIGAPYSLDIPVVDLRDRPAHEREDEARRIAAADAVGPFDLARGPLLRATLVRLDDEEHRLYLTLHHLVVDGVSVYRVLLHELAALYEAAVAGRPSPLPPLPGQYADVARWQRDGAEAGALAPSLAYWAERLGPGAPVTELPADRPRPPVQTFRGATHTVAWPSALARRLRAFSAREQATPFMTLLAAFQVLLHRYTGQDDLVVGTVTGGRSRAEMERLLGVFVNLLALRIDLGGDPSVREVIRRTRDVVLDALAHAEAPFQHVVNVVRPQRDAASHPVFRIVFALEATMTAPPPGWAISHLDVDTGTAKFDLYVELDDRPHGLLGRFVYQTDLFDAATIARLAGHYQRLVEAMLVEPARRISELPLLSDREREELLAAGRGPRADYPAAPVHAVFEAQAARTPDAIAVVAGEQAIAYAALDLEANRLAHHLRSLGVRARDVVAVALERSPELVVALLAILKAGAAYLPLDPSYPAERLAFMLEDGGATALVTVASFAATLPAARPLTVCLDRDRETIAARPADPLASGVTGDDLAYVMYTSGSTGRPKGVAVPHRAVVRLLFGQTYARLGPDEALLQLAPVSFDASTFELWGALLHGGRCVLFPGRVPTAAALGDTIRRHGITTLWLTASVFNAVVDEAPAALHGLRQLLTGGEALSVVHVRRALERLPGIRLVNGYGPTESTTFACCHPIDTCPGADAISIPIGRPIANTDVYVVDRAGALVASGVPGELLIGGDGVACGYVNRPELTAERFVASPLAPGRRLYRTGDRVRWRDGGVLEFLGRFDDQVKIRGYRIEPAEVETALAAHPGVREVAVVAREDGAAGRMLAAYVVPAAAGLDAAGLDAAGLRRFLADRLPPFMIPSAFVTLDALPVTANGKLDRGALPAPRPTAPALVASRTPLEAQLASLWADLLGVDTVGITDDFFALGGDSLLAARMIQQVGELHGVRLPLAALYSHPTIQGLSAALGAGNGAVSPPIVALNAGGGRPPLFFLHGDLHGGGFYSLRLARRLGPDQPLYVVHPLGRDGGEVPRSIEAMAEVHLDTLRRLRPAGPWRLGGYCNGGLVAYEIARRLHAAGEPVELVVVVAAAPHLAFARTWSTIARLARAGGLGCQRAQDAFARFRTFAWRLQQLPPAGRLSLVGAKLAKLVRAVAGRGMGRLPDDFTDGTFDLYFRAVMGYVPEPFPGRVVVLWPDDGPEAAADPGRVWRRLAARVDVRRIPGDHNTVVSRHAALIADHLRVDLT